MTVDILGKVGVIPTDTTERAREAVKVFRSMQPTLTAYARMISGKNVRVEVATNDNGSTDGQRIFYRPPIELGDHTPHDRAVCDKRGPDYVQLCRACAIRETVLVTIYHEIGHLAFDTFAVISDRDKATAIEFAAKESGAKYAERLRETLSKIQSRDMNWYGQLVRHVNPFLPFLVNCMEDARVNRQMFEARLGLEVMFYADTVEIFKNGYEVPDHETGGVKMAHWNEAPLNNQVTIGVFCRASGYDYKGWFHPDVEAALNDDTLGSLVDQIKTITTASGIYNLSFKVLARLRDLGFYATEQDPDPEPEQDESDEQGDAGEGDESDDSSTDPDGEGSPDQEGTSRSSEGREGDAEAAEDSSDGVPEESSSSEEGDYSEGASGSTDGAGGEEADDQDGGVPSGVSGDEEGEVDDQEVDSQAGASDSAEEAPGAGSTDPGGDSSDSESDRGGQDGELPDDREAGGEESLPEGEQGTSGQDLQQPEQAEGGEVDEGDSNQADGSPESGDGSESGMPEGGGQSDGSADSKGSEAGGVRSPMDFDGASSPDRDGPDTDDGPDGESDSGSSSDGNVRGKEGKSGDDGLDSLSGASSEPDGPEVTEDEVAEPRSEKVGDSGDLDGDPIDTGADDGYGGTSIRTPGEPTEPPASAPTPPPRPPMGTPEDVEPMLLKWEQHLEKPKTIEGEIGEAAVDLAIIQGIYFTRPSANVYGVEILKDLHGDAWSAYRGRRNGQVADLEVPNSILQPAIGRMRRVFSDNQRGETLNNLKSGRVNGRVLGRRAWNDDSRLFGKKKLPGKKDYTVVIGMDISGSTRGVNIALEKRAIKGQADMLARVGIPFSIYAHTGDIAGERRGQSRWDHSYVWELKIYVIKEENEPWNAKTIERLERIGPSACNLDGHALEFLRKRMDESRATDKILLYYSDGKMPAENHDEELEILTSEIRTCKNRGITLLGVGIRTDSPARHGLDTVQVDTDADLIKVIEHLDKRISAAAPRR